MAMAMAMQEMHASALGGILDCSLRAVAHMDRPEEEAVQDIASVVGRMAHAVYAAAADPKLWLVSPVTGQPPSELRHAAATAWPHRARVRFDPATKNSGEAYYQAIRMGVLAARMTSAVVTGVTDWLTEQSLHGYILDQPVVGTADRIGYPKGSGRRVVDLKTGRTVRPLAYAVQLGAYLEILELDTDPLIVAVPRSSRIPGLAADAAEVADLAADHVTALNGRECRRMARRAAASWTAIQKGVAKPCPNPGSLLCTAKTCRVHGTADCPLFAS